MTRSDPLAFVDQNAADQNAADQNAADQNAADQDAAEARRTLMELIATRSLVSRRHAARSHTESAIFTLPVEALVTVVTAPLQLFVAHLQMVRNFHRIALIPWSCWVRVGHAANEERQSVIEIERDGRVGIDLKFGSITFKQEETKSYAVALVDVIVESGTRVQMEVKLAADPETESIIALTERFRTHIVATLRAATDTFDATTSHALVFHAGMGAPG